MIQEVGNIDFLKFVGKISKCLPYRLHKTSRFLSPNFIKAVNFLFHSELNGGQIFAGGVIIGSVLAFIAFAFLILFLNPVSSVIISISLGFFSFLLIMNSITQKFNNAIAQIEQQTPYILEELATIYQNTDSIFEAIYYVSQGDYGSLTKSFSKMIPLMNMGISPESLLMDFAVNQPSVTLKRGLFAFVNYVKTNSSEFNFIINEAHEEIQRSFERLTFQWESRMMVYTSLLVFLPIIIVLGLSIRGFANHPMLLLLPIIQYGLSTVTGKVLLPQNSILVGE